MGKLNKDVVSASTETEINDSSQRMTARLQPCQAQFVVQNTETTIGDDSIIQYDSDATLEQQSPLKPNSTQQLIQGNGRNIPSPPSPRMMNQHPNMNAIMNGGRRPEPGLGISVKINNYFIMSPSSPSSSTDPTSPSSSSPSSPSSPSTSISSCSKSYYEILGVHPESNLSTIKDAYRSLILQYHPDKCCQQQANNNNNNNNRTRILSPLEEEEQEQVQDLDTHIDPSSSCAMIDGNEDEIHETNFPSHHDGPNDCPATSNSTSKPQIQSPPSSIPSKTQQQQIKQQQSKESTFVQIQQAWSCLRNEQSRKKYDESLFQTKEKQLQDYSNATPISLSEMDHEEITLVFDDDINDSNIEEHEEYNDDHNDDENDSSYDSEDNYEEDIMYSHDCRCGDRFELFASVLANPYLYPNINNHDRGGKKEEVVLMQCKSCSLSIRVHIDERIPDTFFNSKHFES